MSRALHRNYSLPFLDMDRALGFFLLKDEDICLQCHFGLRISFLQVVPSISQGSMHVFIDKSRIYKQRGDNLEFCVHLDCSKEETGSGSTSSMSLMDIFGQQAWSRAAVKEDDVTLLVFCCHP